MNEPCVWTLQYRYSVAFAACKVKAVNVYFTVGSPSLVLPFMYCIVLMKLNVQRKKKKKSCDKSICFDKKR